MAICDSNSDCSDGSKEDDSCNMVVKVSYSRFWLSADTYQKSKLFARLFADFLLKLSKKNEIMSTQSCLVIRGFVIRGIFWESNQNSQTWANNHLPITATILKYTLKIYKGTSKVTTCLQWPLFQGPKFDFCTQIWLKANMIIKTCTKIIRNVWISNKEKQMYLYYY